MPSHDELLNALTNNAGAGPEQYLFGLIDMQCQKCKQLTRPGIVAKGKRWCIGCYQKEEAPRR